MTNNINVSYFITFLIMLSNIESSFCECENMIFMEEGEMTNYHKRSSSISFPSLNWKNHLIWNNIGEEIFEPLDFNNYELMVHSSNSYKGVIIYRVCKKNTDYNKYGAIMTLPKNGYTIKYNSMLELDAYLYKYHFTNYGTPRTDCYQYNREIQTQKDINTAKKYPVYTLITKYIEVFIYICIIRLVIYIFIN